VAVLLFFVVLPVEDVPLLGAFHDPLLRLQLAAHGGVDELVRAHLVADDPEDVLADLLGVREELDVFVLVEAVQDDVGELNDLLARELQGRLLTG
jgi:hypothetical protein